MSPDVPRILFADQLGPHFVEDQRVIIPEVLGPFRRRRYHRQKAHLILSALRHRAAEMGSTAELRRGETYHEVLSGVDASIVNPTSWGLRALVQDLEAGAAVEVLPSRGFVASEEEFGKWAGTQSTRLLMENFYRHQRRETGILMAPGMNGEPEPEGGRFNFDHDNREAPPKGQETLGVAAPWYPTEDEIDQEVREYLDALEDSGDVSFLGADGPRLFPATRAEALDALEHFVTTRLATFGPHEDAAMQGDWAMSHSLLSPALNLGLLDPREVLERVEASYHQGAVDLASAEGFIRQVMGWRDWVWHLYWHLGADFVDSNYLGHREELPTWWSELDSTDIRSRCVGHVLDEVRTRGWTHHINRLMVLGSFALQRGFNPRALNDWFVDAFVDGTPWVMPANVIGMSQYADGGVVATKPYTSGGAYLNTMTNYCGSCAFKPTVRVGEKACPMSAGYWNFLHTQADALRGNHRMSKPLGGLTRLSDLEHVLEQESSRSEY
ncbi:MAG: cryptochrome/photolyase family protein [Pontimonas sp.]|nr:cryptochrome/photolyase family protein [Pontimonas sp.]